jgi:hypothetical protein
MKKLDEDYWTYKGYDIYLLEHPKLYGKYEIYRNDEFIQRVITLSEAKVFINARVDFLKNPFY